MTKQQFLITFAALVILVFKLRPASPPPSVPETVIAETPTAAEASPQTNKVVLDETKTPSGEIFKAVSGEVVSISGVTLILEAGGDSLQVKATSGTKISQTTLPGGSQTKPQTTEITLNQIQIGQRVDALIKIEGDQAVATNINAILKF